MSRPKIVVLDLDEDLANVWSPGRGLVSETSRIALADDTVALECVLQRAGLTHLDGMAVFLPLPANLEETERAVWCEVIVQLGGQPLVIHRPLAAALELDVWSDGARSHLMIEASESAVDIDVVADGCVLSSRHVPRRDYEMVGRVVAEILTNLDPDDELDIRDEGMNLYGHAARRDALAALSSIDLPLASKVGSGMTVLNGTRLMADESVPWLTR